MGVKNASSRLSVAFEMSGRNNWVRMRVFRTGRGGLIGTVSSPSDGAGNEDSIEEKTEKKD